MIEGRGQKSAVSRCWLPCLGHRQATRSPVTGNLAAGGRLTAELSRGRHAGRGILRGRGREGVYGRLRLRPRLRLRLRVLGPRGPHRRAESKRKDSDAAHTAARHSAGLDRRCFVALRLQPRAQTGRLESKLMILALIPATGSKICSIMISWRAGITSKTSMGIVSARPVAF
jgi:hypothetical protein